MEFKGISFTDIQDEADADPTVDATNAVLKSLLARMTSRWNSMAIKIQVRYVFLGFIKLEWR